jgi:microcystin-dependent protein
MASVTGLTAERMLAIEAASIVDGEIVGDNLILTKHDATTINAGNVRGPIGPTGPTGDVSTAMLNAAILAAVPVGVVWDYIETTPPANWLAIAGQTIVGGQTLYPLLWAKLPPSMKSGANIVFPDSRGRVAVNYNSADTDFDTIGEVGGSKTHVLSQAELPVATIAIDPPATTFSINPPSTDISVDPVSFTATIDPPSTTVSIDPPATTISINPPSTLSGGQTSNHSHGYYRANSATELVDGHDGGTSTYVAAGGESYVSSGTTSGDHAHYVDIPAFNATVDIAAFNVAVNIAPFSATIDPPAFTAAVDILPFDATVDIPSFASGALGSGTPHNNVQPYIVLLKIIKAA